MKKIIYLFCLICTITLAKGQYYRPDRGFLLGINAGYFYPTGDMGKILKNGIGGNVSAKYLINKMIGMSRHGTEPLCLIWVFSSGGISRSSM